MKVRTSHYPANVTVEVQSLDCLVGIALHNNVLYAVESRKSTIFVKDLTGQTIIDPSKLTVPQIREKLKGTGTWDANDWSMTKKPLKEKLQRVLKERTSQRGLASSDKLQMENNIQNPLALAFDKLRHLFVSTKHGEVFKVKVKSDLVSFERGGLCSSFIRLWSSLWNDDCQ